MDEEHTPEWLLGGILTVLLGGGLVIAVALSIVLAPLAPYLALGSGGGGGVCGAASIGSAQHIAPSSPRDRSAVSLVPIWPARVSTASLSLRAHFGAYVSHRRRRLFGRGVGSAS